MDKKTFQERADRIRELNEVIKDLDPAVRSTAFGLLAGYVEEVGKPEDMKKRESLKKQSGADNDLDDGNDNDGANDDPAFFTRIETKKPSDAVRAIAAYHYAQYGNEPFSLDYVRRSAKDFGLTIPNEPNNTLKAATEKGRKLFVYKGNGYFIPTVHGEAFFKSEWNVKKGKKPKPDEPSE